MSGLLRQWGGPDRYPHTAPAPSATVLRASCHCVVFVHVRVHCFSKVDVAAIYFVSQRLLALSCLPACLSSVFSRVNVALIYFVSQSESSAKCRTTRWADKSLSKGLGPPAQGWRATPTLGARSEIESTPTALWLRSGARAGTDGPQPRCGWGCFSDDDPG